MILLDARSRAAIIVIVLTMLALFSAPQIKAAQVPGVSSIMLPLPTGKADEMLEALHKAGGSLKDYTLGEARTQIQARSISVLVLNQMDVFTDPVTSNTPGRYEFGGKSRVPTQDERNKVSEALRQSTTTYLAKRFRVTSGAQFEVVVIASGRSEVYIANGPFTIPYGVEDIRILLLDTQSKSLIWYNDDAWGIGENLNKATDNAKESINKHLAGLVGENTQGEDLTAAAGKGDLPRVEALLAAGGSVNAKRKDDGNTALIVASSNGHIEVVQALIGHGADVNAKSNGDWTALIWASWKGYLDVVQSLLAKGADVNARNEKGQTALMYACEAYKPEVLKVLVQAGADINEKDNDGWTALKWASLNDYVDEVRALIAKGADVNAKANDGSVTLIFASHYGYLDVAKALLANGAEVNVKAKDGTTALGAAITGKYDDVRALLIAAGAKQ
jgi:ankyrin repeat protein